MAESMRRSALAGVLETGTFGANVRRPAVTLAQRRAAALLRLHGATDDPALDSVMRSVVGLELPRAPNTAKASGGCALLWLAPREWLLVYDREQIAIAEQPFWTALDAADATVVDVTHAYVAITLSGERARDVLAKGVPIDIDPVEFKVGTCAQTCLADMNVLLHVRDTNAIDLYAPRSYAVSLWHWLRVSAAEFGYSVT